MSLRSLPERYRIPLIPTVIGAFALLGYVANYWVADDGIIIWRAVEQFHAGNGPVYNEGWRVQVYTSPLWYWLMVGGRYLSKDLYFVTFGLSTVLYSATLILMWLSIRKWIWFGVAIVWFMCSTAFDFTSAGLENGLGFVFVAAFLLYYLRGQGHSRNAGICIVLAGWAMLVRADLMLLFGPPALYLAWQHRAAFSLRQWAGIGLLSLGPMVAWETFSVTYYGSLVPNTYYAKNAGGISRLEYIAMGVDYLKHSALLDPVVCVSLLTATGIALVRPFRDVALAAGVILTLVYVLWIGGDFMVARFFSYAFLGTVITVSFYVSRVR